MSELQALFEPYSGDNIKELGDGCFVVWVPYAHGKPIVLPTWELAVEVESALLDAYQAGSYAGQAEY